MKRLLLAAALCIAGVSHANIVSGFNGAYAVANWTQSPGTGSISTAGAPNSISVTSGDDDSGDTSFTNFYIQFQVDATVNFSWAYATADLDPFFDPFGYELASTVAGLDASFAQLTVDGVYGGASTQSGSLSVFVLAGQYFGFSAWSLDNLGPAATTTINGLPITEVPEPGSLLLLALALAGAGTATRRRRAA